MQDAETGALPEESDVAIEREERELDVALERLRQASTECNDTLERLVDRMSQLLEMTEASDETTGQTSARRAPFPYRA